MYKIESAGLSRVYEHRKRSKCGTISAFRGFEDELYRKYGSINGEKFPEDIMALYKRDKSENIKKTKLLQQILNKHRDKIGYIKVNGVYQESGAMKPEKEISFFVYTLDNDFNLLSFLLNTGKQFSQDSITYAPKDGNFSLICSTPFNYIKWFDGNKYRFGDIIERFNYTIWNKNADLKGNFLQCYTQIRNKQFSFYKTDGILKSMSGGGYNAISAEDVSIMSIKSIVESRAKSVTRRNILSGSGYFEYKIADYDKYLDKILH